MRMKGKAKAKAILCTLLAGVLLGFSGCGPLTDSSQIVQLDRDDNSVVASSSEEGEALLGKSNALPEDGIVTQEQMESIAGLDAEYEFYATDEDTGITYTWCYDASKIQNPVEQNLKVTFTSDSETEEAKTAANDATVGLGFTLEKTNLAAPPTLTFAIPEVWDADTVILIKMVDGEAEKMSDAELAVESDADGTGTTSVTVNVTETGDTYFFVGGKTVVTSADAEDTDSTSDTSSDSTGSSDSSAGSTGNNGTAAAGSDSSETAAQSSTTETTHTCTISIDCITILSNMDDLTSSKAEFVPSDGWILYTSTVEYTPGETVYDVLYRVCRDTGIQMEASYTPAYSSYYVEGINQLYEFDCGNLSGWMYSVNGWFPNYGCSKYAVSDGDVIQWRYTCDLGRDVGDSYYDS